MSGVRFEAFLAELYVDAESRRRFLEDPRATALRAGLDASEAEALAAIDRTALALAARSFAIKRRQSGAPGRQARGRRWLSRLLIAARCLTGERGWR